MSALLPGASLDETAVAALAPAGLCGSPLAAPVLCLGAGRFGPRVNKTVLTSAAFGMTAKDAEL